MEIARKRELTEAEDLTAVTLFGTSEEVMQRSMVMVPKRAAERGLTEADGGVYVHCDEHAILEYNEKQLNQLRTYGFEQQVCSRIASGVE